MGSAYRADHVGTLLRPPELVQARDNYLEGRITADKLREVEDASVLKALGVVVLPAFGGGHFVLD